MYKTYTLGVKGIIPLPPFAWLCNPSSTWSLQWSCLWSHLRHEPWSYVGDQQSHPLESFPPLERACLYGNARGSILVNVGKRSKRMSNSPRLSTSTWATNEVCALGMESLPDMVTIFPSPWKWMLSTSYALVVWGDGESISMEVW